MWGGMLGGLMLLVLAGRRGSLRVDAWGRADWARMVVGGLLIHGAGFVLTFLATSLIGAGKANLLGQIQTFFVVILAVIFLGERFTRRQTAGVALALAGVILLNFDRSAMWVTWGTGETLTLLARLMIAVGIVVMKPLFDHGNAAGSTGVAMVVGALFLFAAYPFSRAGSERDQRGLDPCAPDPDAGKRARHRMALLQRVPSSTSASRAAIIFLSVSFFAVFFQLLVAWRAGPGRAKCPTTWAWRWRGLLVTPALSSLQR